MLGDGDFKILDDHAEQLPSHEIEIIFLLDN